MTVLAHAENHYPVMLPEVLDAISPRDGEVYVDGTFGAGGYSRAILEAADCKVYGIDRDVSAQAAGVSLEADFADRFVFLRGCFGDVQALLSEVGVSHVDGFVLDVGVSSMQIDEGERGFSFRYDGPLDMRMDVEADLTAADIVNTYEEEELANVIYQFGEERQSRRVAKKIVERRAEKKFETTADLADVVRSAVFKKHSDKIDAATRTFQALRIAVNDELGELDRALEASKSILSGGGRLVVVSFHSLEDRRVKTFLKDHSAQGGGSRYLPGEPEAAPAVFDLPYRNKAIKPSDKEVTENARSRSARLRCGVRCPRAEGAS